MSDLCCTWISPTYARHQCVNELIACFLAQDYPGPKRLILLNTFPKQKLIGDFPNVQIINLAQRPPSLGATRNMAIEAAPEGIIILGDDDDIYLARHTSNFARHFTDDIHWVWLGSQFYREGEQIKGIVAGTMNVVAFRKSAWRAVGGYKNMNCGEDRDFVGRLTSQFKGVKVALEPKDISFIYSWGTGAYHISGQGEDKPGQPTGHERLAKWVNERVACGQIPVGDIVLKPALARDYTAQTKLFLSPDNGSKKNDCCVVELGRIGDVINILPVCQHIATQYGKPALMVSREFASLLDGVSYVTPHAVNLANDQLLQALELARKTFRNVIQAQVWGGPDYPQECKCPSYNMESWRIAGFLHKFNDRSWRPVFDRRNTETERAIVRKVDRGKPILATALLQSVSSPFAGGQALLDALRVRWPQLDIVELSQIQAPHIYDLLGLIEKAVALVTIDTAFLHLAAATDVPTIALVNPQPWLGTIPRGNCILRLPYNEVSTEKINDAIAKCLPGLNVTAPIRRLIHVVERHEDPHLHERQRKQVSRKSWDALYDQGVAPCHVWNYPRNAMSIGDPRPLPFLKDVLEAGLRMAADDDIIMLTNDDIFLHRDLPNLLHLHIPLHGACCGQRCEFNGRPIPPAHLSPTAFALHGGPHMGRDLFAFTKRWLAGHWRQIPDFVCGASEWDLCLAAMIRLEHGALSTRQNFFEILPPSDIPRGYLSHQYHTPFWANPTNANSASQVRNRALFRQWAEKHLPSLKFNPGNVI